MNYKRYLCNKNYSDNTIKSYLLFSKKIDDYFRNHQENRTNFVKYIKSYSSSHSANSTRLCYAASLNYLRWKKSKILKNFETMKLPKIIFVNKLVLSEEKINFLLNTLDKNSWYQYRLLLILTILFFTGLRASELLSLKTKEMLKNKIIINGKGNKQRYVFIAKNIQLLCLNWKYKWICCDKNGKKITQKQLNLIIKSFGEKHGINNLTPHVFRRSFCTNLLKKHCNLKAIQLLMGHSNISTTSRYFVLNENELEDEYKKCFQC